MFRLVWRNVLVLCGWLFGLYETKVERRMNMGYHARIQRLNMFDNITLFDTSVKDTYCEDTIKSTLHEIEKQMDELKIDEEITVTIRRW
jgi:hypothetical protein